MREAILIEAPEYFGFLLKECEPSLLALAYRITGDREAALDIVQNAYENALRALGTFRGDSKVSTWLYRITVNTALNFLRAEQKRRKRFPEIPLNEDEALLVSSDSTPEDLCYRREFAKIMLNALMQLPERDRSICVLALSGLSGKECAHAASIGEGTVKSRYFRARKSLQVHLRNALYA